MEAQSAVAELTESLIRPRDLAELLGVPVATQASWRCAGKGPPFLKVGRHVRYRPSDVEVWIASRVTTPEIEALRQSRS